MNNNQNRTSISFIDKLRNSVFIILALISTNIIYSSAQDITLKMNNSSLVQVIDEIEAISEYKFIYSLSAYDFNKVISVDVTDENIDNILEIIFNNEINYEIVDDKIILQEKNISSNLTVNSSQDEIQATVTGKITDSNGIPLPGASIIESGTSNGTTSDFDGNFSLDISDEDAILEISFIGFTSQTISASNSDNIQVSLVASRSALDEVVLTGYGSTLKRELVSSISQVSADELTNQPASNVSNILQGKAAGVSVISNNGEPGSRATISIRGISSISGNNGPLYVIDDVIVGTDFDLNNINVNDIQSIEILKDASSLAIYGTRGAAGVILIQTKSGLSTPEGSVEVSLNHYTSFDEVRDMPELGDVALWKEYWSEGLSLIPGEDGYGANDPNFVFPYDDRRDTDWNSAILRDGQINNTDLNISGNSENTNYFVSISRFDQKGVVKGSGLLRNGLRLNLDTKVNDKLRTGIRFSLVDRKQENQKLNWSNVYYQTIPYWQIYEADGQTYTGVNPISGIPQRNPVADVTDRIDHSFITNLNSNAYIEYDLIPGLTLKSSLGINMGWNKNNYYLPTYIPPRSVANSGGIARVRHNQNRNYLFENTATYSFENGDHSLKILAGYTRQKTTSTMTMATGEGYPNDVLTFNNLSLGADPESNLIGSNYGQRTYTSILSRINYGYMDRYFLTLVARRDGSSVFETGNKYATFPSIGAAWIVSEEDFMQNQDVISNLKLRASYGIVGEQGVPPYNSFARYNDEPMFLNDGRLNTVLLSSIPSQGLEWEKTYQSDVGLEIGFANNRYSLEFDYYEKRTEDLLLEKPLPYTAGNTRLENVGEIENKGFELSISSVNIEKEDFVWSTSLSLSQNKSELISLGDGQDYITLDDVVAAGNGSPIRLTPGYPIPSFWGANNLGTYKTRSEIDADGRFGTSFLGGPRLEDQNGDGTWNPLDYVYQGSPEPDLFGGIRNVFSYKKWTLDTFAHFSIGNTMFNGSVAESYYARGAYLNLLPELKDRWTEENYMSDIPRAGTAFGTYVTTNETSFQDGSFFRLKNVTLTYDLDNPPFVRDASIYLSAQNLLLISDYKWGDPEVSQYGNQLNRGVSDSTYPYSTSVSLGLNIKF